MCLLISTNSRVLEMLMEWWQSKWFCLVLVQARAVQPATLHLLLLTKAHWLVMGHEPHHRAVQWATALRGDMAHDLMVTALFWNHLGARWWLVLTWKTTLLQHFLGHGCFEKLTLSSHAASFSADNMGSCGNGRMWEWETRRLL